MNPKLDPHPARTLAKSIPPGQRAPLSWGDRGLGILDALTVFAVVSFAIGVVFLVWYLVG